MISILICKFQMKPTVLCASPVIPWGPQSRAFRLVGVRELLDKYLAAFNACMCMCACALIYFHLMRRRLVKVIDINEKRSKEINLPTFECLCRYKKMCGGFFCSSKNLRFKCVLHPDLHYCPTAHSLPFQSTCVIWSNMTSAWWQIKQVSCIFFCCRINNKTC